jgi:hypothetical protein
MQKAYETEDVKENNCRNTYQRAQNRSRHVQNQRPNPSLRKAYFYMKMSNEVGKEPIKTGQKTGSTRIA